MTAKISGAYMAVSVDSAASVRCEVQIDRQRIDVSSSKPDKNWTANDHAGHFHAWADDETLPTLFAKEVPMPCDGSCGGVCGGEGYTRTKYTCRICGDELWPNTVDDSGPRSIAGRTEWTIVAYGPVEADGPVSVRVSDGNGTEYFSVARVVGSAIGADGGSRTELSCEAVGRRSVRAS